MSRVVHFELFAGDPGELAEFYRSVFGWGVSAWEGPVEYYLAETGPKDAMGIDGAIAPFGRAGSQQTVVTIGVGDIAQTLTAVTDAGGTIVSEAQEVPGVGLHAYCADPSGLVFSVLEPSPMDQQATTAAPASAGAEQASPQDAWAEVGDRLRDFGVTLGAAVQDAASSPQAQKLREQAEGAAVRIGEATRTAADNARPHVISALDTVSAALGGSGRSCDRSGRGSLEAPPPESRTLLETMAHKAILCTYMAAQAGILRINPKCGGIVARNNEAG